MPKKKPDGEGGEDAGRLVHAHSLAAPAARVEGEGVNAPVRERFTPSRTRLSHIRR
jgi:hypothetical protein